MHPIVDSALPLSHVRNPWISWSAVLAGVTTTIAVQIGLTELCIASGLALFHPTDPGSETAALAIGTVAALLLCALISVFIGGWVAGRMKSHHSCGEAAIHGMLVWAVAGVAALLLTTISVGILAGGAFSLLGQGISGAAKGIGAALPAAVTAAAPSWDAVKTDLASAMDKRDADNANPAWENRFADRSRLMQLLAQSFVMDGKPLTDAVRNETIKLVASQFGISPEAARATYDQWLRVWDDGLRRFAAVKEEARSLTQQGAATAAKHTAQAAIVAFIAMVVGLGAAIAGALCGRACVMKCLASSSGACDTTRSP
jgi:hypothetical protein